MKQIEKEAHVIAGYDKLTGNDEARAQAEKIKASIDSIQVDKDKLMLAERNDVLDAAIARLKGGAAWTEGYLASTHIEEEEGCWTWTDTLDHFMSDQNRTTEAITVDKAALMRDKGQKFCLIGTIGAQEGIHSHEAIDEAVTAVSVAASGRTWGESYGYSSGGIFAWNDANHEPGKILEALVAAKSQPLSKSYNE